MRTAISVLCGLVLALSLVVLGPAITLWQTLLNPGFLAGELERFDTYPLIADQLKAELPPEAAFLEPVIETAAADLSDWTDRQVAEVARAATAYLKGEQQFRALISLAEPKAYLVANLGRLLDELPPGTLPPIPPAQMDVFVQMVSGQISAMMPDTLLIDEGYLDAETMSMLQTGREYTGLLVTAMWVAGVVALVMLLTILLVWRGRPRPVSRYVGIPLALAGATCLALAFTIPPLITGEIAGQVPAEVVPMVSGIVSDVAQPLFIYSGVVLAVGLVLVVLSFVFRPSEL